MFANASVSRQVAKYTPEPKDDAAPVGRAPQDKVDCGNAWRARTAHIADPTDAGQDR